VNILTNVSWFSSLETAGEVKSYPIVVSTYASTLLAGIVVELQIWIYRWLLPWSERFNIWSGCSTYPLVWDFAGEF